MTPKYKFVRLIRTLITTCFAYAVNYGTMLVLTPYITRTVGTEAYGFVSLGKQFAQYAVILTTALDTYASRYIGIAYHGEDKRQANIYFSSVFWGDTILASVIFVCAVVMILFLEHLIQIPTRLITDVKILFLLVFMNFWVSTVCAVFGCTGFVKNKLDIMGIFKTLSYITNALVLFAAYVLLPAHVCYVALGTLATTCVVALSNIWMTRHYIPEFNVNRSDFSFAAVKHLVIEGSCASFNSVGEMLNNGLDLIVCNEMLSSLAMGQLAIAKTIQMLAYSMYSVVNQAFVPVFLRSYAEGDKEKLLDELKMSMKVSGFLANTIFAGFVSLGLLYYQFWIPGQDQQLIYKLTVITILTCIPSGAMQPLYYIYTLTITRKFPCIVTIIGGLFNVLGMYVLIKYCGIGVYAVAWTTSVVMAVINFGTNPIYMAHVLELPWWTFYPDIVKNVISSITMVIAFKIITHVYMPVSWVTMIITVVCLVLVGIPIHFVIVFNKKQWNKLIGLVQSVLPR